MEALRIEHVSKSFGGVHALSDVSFNVEEGERLGIIGPNGAGKTTLFNLINGQMRATAGKIYYFGQDITDMPAHCRAHLGQSRSFQITSLFPNLSILDSTLITLHGTKRSRFNMFRPTTGYDHFFARAQQILTGISLWEQKDELVKNLSCGHQRRLEIALTEALEPKLLLLDEPSCGLTSAESAEISDSIRGLDRDITVLLVAHDMDLVFGAAARIMVLHYGKIIADGKPEEIRADARIKEIYMGIEEDEGNIAAT